MTKEDNNTACCQLPYHLVSHKGLAEQRLSPTDCAHIIHDTQASARKRFEKGGFGGDGLALKRFNKYLDYLELRGIYR